MLQILDNSLLLLRCSFKPVEFERETLDLFRDMSIEKLVIIHQREPVTSYRFCAPISVLIRGR